jgi:hypothetical protein
MDSKSTYQLLNSEPASWREASELIALAEQAAKTEIFPPRIAEARAAGCKAPVLQWLNSNLAEKRAFRGEVAQGYEAARRGEVSRKWGSTEWYRIVSTINSTTGHDGDYAFDLWNLSGDIVSQQNLIAQLEQGALAL